VVAQMPIQDSGRGAQMSVNGAVKRLQKHRLVRSDAVMLRGSGASRVPGLTCGGERFGAGQHDAAEPPDGVRGDQDGIAVQSAIDGSSRLRPMRSDCLDGITECRQGIGSLRAVTRSETVGDAGPVVHVRRSPS
jgi:hypothetical protein